MSGRHGEDSRPIPSGWDTVRRYYNEPIRYEYRSNQDQKCQVILRAAAVVWCLFDSSYGRERLHNFFEQSIAKELSLGRRNTKDAKEITEEFMYFLLTARCPFNLCEDYDDDITTIVKAEDHPKSMFFPDQDFIILFKGTVLSCPAYEHKIASLASDIIGELAYLAYQRYVRPTARLEPAKVPAWMLNNLFFGGRIYSYCHEVQHDARRTRAFVLPHPESSFVCLPTRAWIESFILTGELLNQNYYCCLADWHHPPITEFVEIQFVKGAFIATDVIFGVGMVEYEDRDDITILRGDLQPTRSSPVLPPWAADPILLKNIFVVSIRLAFSYLHSELGYEKLIKFFPSESEEARAVLTDAFLRAMRFNSGRFILSYGIWDLVQHEPNEPNEHQRETKWSDGDQSVIRIQLSRLSHLPEEPTPMLVGLAAMLISEFGELAYQWYFARKENGTKKVWSGIHREHGWVRPIGRPRNTEQYDIFSAGDWFSDLCFGGTLDFHSEGCLTRTWLYLHHDRPSRHWVQDFSNACMSSLHLEPSIARS